MAYINELCADIVPGGLYPLFVSYPIERMSDEQLEKVLDEGSIDTGFRCIRCGRQHHPCRPGDVIIPEITHA